MNDLPRVRVVKKPSDFGRRSSAVLLQIGTTCSCCCLMWVGSAFGGSLGLIVGWRTPRGSGELRVHRRRILFGYALLGSALLAFFTAMFCGWIQLTESNTLNALLGGLIMTPPLNFLLLGFAAMLIGRWSSRRASPEEQAAVHRFACRLTWMSFNVACIGWILSVGIMTLDNKFTPPGCFYASLANLAVVLGGGMCWNVCFPPAKEVPCPDLPAVAEPPSKL